MLKSTQLLVAVLLARNIAAELLEEWQLGALGLARHSRLRRELHVHNGTLVALVVHEAAARAIRTCAGLLVVAAHFRLVLRVAQHGTKLMLAVSELALGAVAARARLTPAPADLRLIKVLVAELLLRDMSKGRNGPKGT